MLPSISRTTARPRANRRATTSFEYPMHRACSVALSIAWQRCSSTSSQRRLAVQTTASLVAIRAPRSDVGQLAK